MGWGGFAGGVADGFMAGLELKDKQERTDNISRRTDIMEDASQRAQDKHNAWREEQAAETAFTDKIITGMERGGMKGLVVRDGPQAAVDPKFKSATDGTPTTPTAETDVGGGDKPVRTAALQTGTVSDAGGGFAGAAAEADGAVTGKQPPVQGTTDVGQISYRREPDAGSDIPDAHAGVTLSPPGAPPIGLYQRALREAKTPAEKRVAFKHLNKAIAAREKWATEQLDRRLTRENIGLRRAQTDLAHAGVELREAQTDSASASADRTRGLTHNEKIAGDVASLKLNQAKVFSHAQRLQGSLTAFDGVADTVSLSTPDAMANAGVTINALEKTFGALHPGGKVDISPAKGGGFSYSLTDENGESITTGELKTVGQLRQLTTQAYMMSGPKTVTPYLAAHNLTGAMRKMQKEVESVRSSKAASETAENEAAKAASERASALDTAAVSEGLPALKAQTDSQALKLKGRLQDEQSKQGYPEKKVQADTADANVKIEVGQQLEAAQSLRKDYMEWSQDDNPGTTEHVRRGQLLRQRAQMISHPSMWLEKDGPLFDEHGEVVTDDNGKAVRSKQKINIMDAPIRAMMPPATGVTTDKEGNKVNVPIASLASQHIGGGLREILVHGLDKGLTGDELIAYAVEKSTPIAMRHRLNMPYQRDLFMKQISKAVPIMVGAVKAQQAQEAAAAATRAKSNEELDSAIAGP